MTREQIFNLPQPIRWAAQMVWPTGQHRPDGALVGQQFVDCPVCEVSTAATVHGSAIRCTEGHLVAGVTDA